MLRTMLSIALLAAACGCTSGVRDVEEPASPEAAILGRWDVTAEMEGRTFPLWFEITRENDQLSGRFQPRGGHALPMDSLEVSDSELRFTVGETSVTGRLEEGRLSGTVTMRGDRTATWTAVRAPELPVIENPHWGEAMTLFNGKDLSGWKPHPASRENFWTAQDGVLASTGSGSNLVTEASFQDFKLHIEVNCPEESNSGIYLRGRHEIQVADSYGKEAHSRQMGGVYGQITPTSNASKPAGEWQSFDITLLGRWVTIELNSVTIIDNQEIPGITGGALDSNEGEPGPLLLQGDHGPISYRNIVLTPVVAE